MVFFSRPLLSLSNQRRRRRRRRRRSADRRRHAASIKRSAGAARPPNRRASPRVAQPLPLLHSRQCVSLSPDNDKHALSSARAEHNQKQRSPPPLSPTTPADGTPRGFTATVRSPKMVRFTIDEIRMLVRGAASRRREREREREDATVVDGGCSSLSPLPPPLLKRETGCGARRHRQRARDDRAARAVRCVRHEPRRPFSVAACLEGVRRAPSPSPPRREATWGRIIGLLLLQASSSSTHPPPAPSPPPPPTHPTHPAIMTATDGQEAQHPVRFLVREERSGGSLFCPANTTLLTPPPPATDPSSRIQTTKITTAATCRSSPTSTTVRFRFPRDQTGRAAYPVNDAAPLIDRKKTHRPKKTKQTNNRQVHPHGLAGRRRRHHGRRAGRRRAPDRHARRRAG